jgi:hypothetical protein
MPRDGSGASDNKVEETHDVIHGAGKEEVRFLIAYLQLQRVHNPLRDSL